MFVNFCRSYAPFRTLNNGNTQFSAVFSYMLWHIALKCCIWICSTVLQIVWVSSICVNFCRSHVPFRTYNNGNTQFSAVFSYMLWHIALKFCMSLSSYEHSIKFECRQCSSIFAGVMPLLELKILEIHSFHSFLLHALTYCAEMLHSYEFVLLHYRSSLCGINLRQFL